MSLVLFPVALFLVGVTMAFLRTTKLVDPLLAKISGYVVVVFLVFFSIALFLDFLTWPVNFDGRSVEGSVWLFHTDLTGIYKPGSAPNDVEVRLTVNVGWFILTLGLFPVAFWLGYNTTLFRTYKNKLHVVRGLKTSLDVQLRTPCDKSSEFSYIEKGQPTTDSISEFVGKIFNPLEAILKPKDLVVIKVTISSGNPDIPGSYTNPTLVGHLANRIYAITHRRPLVVDSDHLWVDFDLVAHAQGWGKAAKEYNFKLVNLSSSNVVLFDFGIESTLGQRFVSTLLTKADLLIHVPAFKSDLLTGINGTSSLVEIFPERNKAVYHNLDPSIILNELVQTFRPFMTIIDGRVAVERLGPLTYGRVRSELSIASTDPLEADRLMAQQTMIQPKWLGEFDPPSDGHIKEKKPDITPVKEKKPWDYPPKARKHYRDIIKELTNEGLESFVWRHLDPLLKPFSGVESLQNLPEGRRWILADILYSWVNLSHLCLLSKEQRKIVNQKLGSLRHPEVEQENWPNGLVTQTIQEIGLLDPPVHNYPSEELFRAVDNPSEVGSFAEAFYPTVSTRGVELLDENNSPAWAGTQHRLLESLDGTERVLQLLLVWTKQRYIFSYYYNMMVPFLLGLFGIILVSSAKEESQAEATLAVSLVVAVLWLLGGPILVRSLWRYYHDRSIVVRNPQFFPIYGILFLVALADIADKFHSQGSQLLFLEVFGNVMDVNVPIVSVLFFGITALTGILIFIFGDKTIVASHDMDYGPIWVYLTQSSGFEELERTKPTSWQISRVCFDAYHYDVKCYTRGELIELKALRNGRVQIDIDNNWHSFHLSSSSPQAMATNVFSYVGIIIALVSIIGLILAPFVLWGTSYLIILDTILFLTMMGGLYLTVALFRSSLVEVGVSVFRSTLESPKYYLTPTKLHILWNLRAEEARLKIHEKYLDPFNPNISWKRWDDTIPETFTDSPIIDTHDKLPNILVLLFWLGGFVFTFILGNFFSQSSHLLLLMIVTGGVLVVISGSILNLSKEELISLTQLSAIIGLLSAIVFQTSGFSWMLNNATLLVYFAFPLLSFLSYASAVGLRVLFRYELEHWDKPSSRVVLLSINLIGALATLMSPDLVELLFKPSGSIALVLIISVLAVGCLYIGIVPLRQSLPIYLSGWVLTLASVVISHLSSVWTFASSSVGPALELNYVLGQLPLFWVFYLTSAICVVQIIIRFVQEIHLKVR